MLNLNDSQYEVKSTKFFNNGVAGIVNNCKIRVERKKATDPENAPKYKVILTDENGGEVNRAYFGIKPDSSDGLKTFFVKEMKHLANIFGATLPEQIESYDALLSFVMKAGYETEGKLSVNAVVDYGTTKYPSKWLGLSSGFSIVLATEVPYVKPDMLMTRPEPTQQEADAINEKLQKAANDDWGAEKTDGLPF